MHNANSVWFAPGTYLPSQPPNRPPIHPLTHPPPRLFNQGKVTRNTTTLNTRTTTKGCHTIRHALLKNVFTFHTRLLNLRLLVLTSLPLAIGFKIYSATPHNAYLAFHGVFLASRRQVHAVFYIHYSYYIQSGTQQSAFLDKMLRAS